MQQLEGDWNRELVSSASNQNINACIAIADVLKSTLGPSGMDKLLIDKRGNMLITNDGATILRHLKVEQPAAVLLVELAMAQDENIGDGTTSVVLLAAELLKKGLELTNRGLHPLWITKGYRTASEIALSTISEIAIQIPSAEKDQWLLYIARTCLSSKILGTFKDHFCKIAIDAVKCLEGTKKVRNINIVKKTGSSIESSTFINGILLNKKVCLGCPNRVENARILITRMDLDSFRTKIWGTTIKVESHEQGAQFAIKERELIRERCKKMIELGVNVVINQGQIFSVAEQVFAEYGVMAIEINDFSECESISLATGCPIIGDLSEITSDQKFGEAKLVEEIVISDSRMIKISGCSNPQSCTVLLRAPTSSILDECDRSLHDVLCVLAVAVSSEKYIAGGGAVQIEIAKRLRDAAILEKDRSQFAIEAFADSLESLPLTLAQNGGFDGIQLLSECRQLHQKAENVWMGINMEDGTIVDMVNTLRVIEPANVFESVIKCATEVAEMIIRVDVNIRMKPLKPFVLQSVNE